MGKGVQGTPFFFSGGGWNGFAATRLTLRCAQVYRLNLQNPIWDYAPRASSLAYPLQVSHHIAGGTFSKWTCSA
jgi:hypothetical protein